MVRATTRQTKSGVKKKSAENKTISHPKGSTAAKAKRATKSAATKSAATKSAASKTAKQSVSNQSKSTKTRKPAKTKKVNRFHQLLGRLTVSQAIKLLGDDGNQLLSQGSQKFEIDHHQDVYLGGDLYRVRVKDSSLSQSSAVVSVTLFSGRQKRLLVNCNHCETPCEHAGAALHHLLDGKDLLGLAGLPDETVPLEHLTDQELFRRMMAERQQRAVQEKMVVKPIDPSTPYTDYVVTSQVSGQTYRVALRGDQPGDSYCSCPDFRSNQLGTCKHILHVIGKAKKRHSATALSKPYRRKHLSLKVSYLSPSGLLFNLPYDADEKLTDIIGDAATVPIDGATAMKKIQVLNDADYDIHIYPDAEEWIQRDLVQTRLQSLTQQIRKDPKNHKLRTSLLKAQLLPYQLDGITFAVGAGRAILADDMGLGKTIQGIGVAELLAREADIGRVLVVCPASLKSQWKGEIERFCDRSVQLVIGSAAERQAQYASDNFFTICNYEQVRRDLGAIESVTWDLIILDEGQRIKNWESKTSQLIRSLTSRFALVLSGTPMENKLDELFTVVRFIDDRKLGPAYQFFHRHRLVDDRGKILGYRHLEELRDALKPILLRRRRDDVVRQLPERTDQVIQITPTEEQLAHSTHHLNMASRIAAKRFWTEMDLLMLQKHLLMARLAANSTFLLDQQEPEFSSKMEVLTELLTELIDSPQRKIVLFSEWRRMLDRVELRLNKLGCDYVRLDGSVPQKKRPPIVNRFQTQTDCRVILMTNAGSTGLNLQSADTVINVDLPWNPAVLEQRIARAHRMGQKNPVHVYKLVTENTIEGRLLDTLDCKQQLADAAINFDSDVSSVAMQSGMADLKLRLEKILPPANKAPIDESRKLKVEAETAAIQSATQQMEQRKEKVAAAGGQLIGAALSLVAQLVDQQDKPAPDEGVVNQLTDSLAQCIQRDAIGRPQLTLTLENDQSLRGLAETLARLLK